MWPRADFLTSFTTWFASLVDKAIRFTHGHGSINRVLKRDFVYNEHQEQDGLERLCNCIRQRMLNLTE